MPKLALLFMCLTIIGFVFHAQSLALVDETFVGAWTFDREGNEIEDVSGNKNTGVIVGDPKWDEGKFGKALLFDGIDDYVDITGYKGITGSQSRTVTAWIETSNSAAIMSIASWGDKDNTAGRQWTFYLENGKLAVKVWSGKVIADTLVADGSWHHVAAVLEDDGSPNIEEIKFYVDAKQDEIGSPASQIVDTEEEVDVTIGAAMQPNVAGVKRYFFDGMIDEVRIYSRALTQTEIEKIMKREDMAVSSFGRLITTWASIRKQFTQPIPRH
jgi:hypothetical protein